MVHLYHQESIPGSLSPVHWDPTSLALVLQTLEKISSIQVPVELTVSINFLTAAPPHLLVGHGMWMLSQAPVVLGC